VGGKNGKDGRGDGRLSALSRTLRQPLPWGTDAPVRHDMRLFKVLAAPGDAAMIELIYR